MTKYTAEQQAAILTEIGRRRRNEGLIVMSMLACAFLLVMSNRVPGFHVPGLSHAQLLVVASMVGVAGLVLHRRNWRCPACGVYLRKKMGAACLSCGAVFIAAPARAGGGVQPGGASAQQAAAEKALQRELRFYKVKTARAMMMLVVIFCFGIVLLCVGVGRVLDESDKQTITFVFTLGGSLVIASVCLRIAIGRRLTSEGPAYEARLREKLGLPPAGGGAAT